jgi:hypothetical protein
MNKHICASKYKYKDIIKTYICRLPIPQNIGDEENLDMQLFITRALCMLITSTHIYLTNTGRNLD